MKKILMILLVAVLVSGCATSTLHPRITNTVTVFSRVYCGFMHNIERRVVEIVRATVDSGWVPTCEALREREAK